MPTEAPARPTPFNQILGEALKDVDAAKLAETTKGKAAPPPAQPKSTPPPEQKPAVTEPKPVNFDEVDKEIESGRRIPKTEDFKRIKHAAEEGWKKAKELEPKLKDYEKELAELKKAPKHNAELIKQVTDERDKYKSMFEQVAVELSPEFQTKYQKRLESVKSTLPAETADKLMALLQLPDSDVKRKHLADITADMDEFAVAEIVAANREVRTILNERQGELARAQESLNKIGEERSKKEQERAAALGKTFEEVIAKAQDPKAGIPVFQVKDGDEAWNKGVSERTEIAKAIFQGKFENDAERAEAGLWAAAAPAFLEQLKTVTAELESKNAIIAKMQGSAPSIDGRGGPSQDGRKLTFAEKVTQDMKGK